MNSLTRPRLFEVLREERIGFIILAALLLVAQSFLPLAASALSRDGLASLGFGICAASAPQDGDPADEGLAGLMHIAGCLCGPACPHVDCPLCLASRAGMTGGDRAGILIAHSGFHRQGHSAFAHARPPARAPPLRT